MKLMGGPIWLGVHTHTCTCTCIIVKEAYGSHMSRRPFSSCSTLLNLDQKLCTYMYSARVYGGTMVFVLCVCVCVRRRVPAFVFRLQKDL